jgi:hypothetical protein
VLAKAAPTPRPVLLVVYLPSRLIFSFASSFIFWTVGSRLASPVVWVLVAGGLLLRTEVCCGNSFAGRVAVAGDKLFCALAAWMFKSSKLADVAINSDRVDFLRTQFMGRLL